MEKKFDIDDISLDRSILHDMEKNKLKYSKIRILVILSIVLGSIVSILVFINYKKNIKNMIEKADTAQLLEVAKQNSQHIESEMINDIKSLETMASFLSKEKKSDVETIRKILKKEAEKKSFIRMGVTNAKGDYYTNCDKEYNVANREYFKKAMKGESNISEPFVSPLDGKIIIVYAVPIYNDNKVNGALIAVHDVEILDEILPTETFNGKGYSYIINRNGDIILRSDNKGTDKDIKNIYEKIKLGHNSKLQREINDGKQGIKSCNKKSNNSKYIAYTPINGINDWYVLSIIPSSFIYEKSAPFINLTIFTIVMLTVLFVVLIIYSDIMRAKSKKEIEKLAFVDNVTGYGNLNKFKIDVANHMRKNTDEKYVLVKFDIEKFRYINEKFGYNEGTKVLIEISNIINRSLKGRGYFFTRASNDNYIILMKYTDDNSIIETLERINSQIDDLNNETFSGYKIVANFGIYKIKSYEEKIFSIMNKVNLAQNLAKESNKSKYVFYDENISKKIKEEKELIDRMHLALEKEEFEVYIQPKFSIETMEIVGGEALVRWNHPDKELISPDKFIPLFEKNKFIVDLDIYIFEKVCKLLRQWTDSGKKVIHIAVNLSRVNIENPTFIKNFKFILEKYNIEPSFIELEITESALYDGIHDFPKIIDRLKRIGFGISIDDFGAGYSSFNTIKDVKVDTLKLDREFFKYTVDDDRCRKVIASIISMAKSLDTKVVSEGVETEGQVEFLRSIGCDMAQGYFFDRPLSVYVFEEKYI